MITTWHNYAIFAKKLEPCRFIIQEQADLMQCPLYAHQEALVKAASVPGNHIIVAGTGTGKTRVAVELSRKLLLSKPKSHVVFLAQSVTLAQQQAGDACDLAFKPCNVY